MKYFIDLCYENFVKLAKLRKAGHASLSIQGKQKQVICVNAAVLIKMSKNALLGLGKELIRCAHNNNMINKHWHVEVSRQGSGLVQTLGLFLIPTSIEFIMNFSGKAITNSPGTHEAVRKYEFEINRIWGFLDDFEQTDDNVAEVQAFDKYHINISDQLRYVLLSLDTEAMIGFGTELIRLAHNFEEGKEVKIIPSSKENGAQQSMGIFLTPESCELVIKCENFKPIDTYIDETKSEMDKN